jgi:hypothetical protein
VPLDRNQRARFRFLLNAHRQARRLTRAARDVGGALLKRLGENGHLDPSYRTLARDADCDPRTVGRALTAMRALGLIRWDRRIVRSGWRAEQTSNAYELLTMATEPEPLPRSGFRCDGQNARETRFVLIQKPDFEVREAQAALARARQRMEARMLGKGRKMLPAIWGASIDGGSTYVSAMTQAAIRSTSTPSIR